MRRQAASALFLWRPDTRGMTSLADTDTLPPLQGSEADIMEHLVHKRATERLAPFDHSVIGGTKWFLYAHYLLVGTQGGR